jgi:hypothetical protein
MKEYLRSIIPSIKNFSQSLDKTSLLIDKPWVLIDENHDVQKLIFKKNKELILSNNGQVTLGSWDYLAEAKCLLIDRGTDKILCNQGYIDEGILILKLDASVDQFFILANQNIITDLNVFKYILWKRRLHLNIRSITLSTGEILEAFPKEEWRANLEIGDEVSIDLERVADGEYFVARGEFDDFTIKLTVKDSLIANKKYLKQYKSKDGIILIVEQTNPFVSYKIGDKVVQKVGVIKDKKYKIIGARYIHVRNGVIFKKSFF